MFEIKINATVKYIDSSYKMIEEEGIVTLQVDDFYNKTKLINFEPKVKELS